MILAGCSGGGSDSNGAVDADDPDREAPRPPQILSVNSFSPERIQLTWLPATDNSSNADDLVYAVHASATENFSPSSANLQRQITGETTTDLDGLQTATTYFIKIIAIDEAGNRSAASDQASRSTAAKPMRLKSQPFSSAESLNLPAPSVDADGTTYRYANSGNSQLPAVDSLLFGLDATGGGYLRRILTVTENGAEIIVTTGDASLSEIIDEGELNMAVTLRDIEGTAAALGSSSPTIPAIARRGSGESESKLVLNDGLIVIEQKNLALPSGNQQRLSSIAARSNPSLQQKIQAKSFTTEAGDSKITLGATIDFEPTIETDFDYSLVTGLTRALVVASGTMTLDGILGLEYGAEETKVFDKDLTSITFVQTYAIPTAPPIPVYQEITLTLKAQFDVKVSGAVTASTELDSAVNASFGMKYENGAWQLIGEKSVDNSMTFSFGTKGGVEARVRVYPEMRVRFYTVASGYFSLEPYIFARSAVEVGLRGSSDTDEILQLYNLTDFSAGLGLAANAFADIKVFSKEIARTPEEGKHNLFELEYKLLSIPKLDWQPSSPVGGPSIHVAGPSVEIFAKVDDFISEISTSLDNRFVPESIFWHAYPSSGIITRHPSDPYRVSFTPGEEGIVYEIYFGGYSELLGELGQQYTMVKIDMKDDDLDGMPNDWEKFYGLNPLLLADAADDLDSDFLSNVDEYRQATRPNIKDSDMDDMWDGWEVLYGLDPLLNDAALDPDDDKKTNLTEFNFDIINRALRPDNADTDGDLLDDGWEIDFETNPLVFSANDDPDNDSLTNLEEYQQNTHPNLRDADNDGLEDPQELAAGTDPFNEDSDKDGMWDGWEVLYEFDPLQNDADGDPDEDGLTNYQEFINGSNPRLSDSDPPGPTPGTSTTVNLNDTGAELCSDGSFTTLDAVTTDCPIAAYPRQDADEGRDSYAARLVKRGGGASGFDFTKLDASGTPLVDQALDYASQPWECVQDNVTGLTWEVKKPSLEITYPPEVGFRNEDLEWNWYDPDPATNGGHEGSMDGGTCSGVTDGSCVIRGDSAAYAEEANRIQLCGYDNWRLPTLNEALSIVSVNNYNVDYFPIAPLSWTWTSITYKDTRYVSEADANIYAFIFKNDGSINFGEKDTGAYQVRLVRDAQ